MDELLAVLVQHSAFTQDSRVYCRLMMSAKALRRLLLELCSGQLAATCCLTDDQVVQDGKWTSLNNPFLLRWLVRNGCLLRQLSLELPHASEDYSRSPFRARRAAIAKAVAAEFRLAVLTRQLQQLQSLEVSYADAALLECLPPGLTCLQVAVVAGERPAAVGVGLAGLLGLQSLALALDRGQTAPKALSNWRERCHIVAQALAGKGCLRSLRLRNWADLAGLKRLPPQLLELQLQFGDAVSLPLADLGPTLSHLTALTELQVHALAMAQQQQQRPGSGQAMDAPAASPPGRLPPSLRRLTLPDCVPSVAPLLGLSQLRQLAVTGSSTPAPQLLQLGAALTQLTDVRLEYSDNDTAAAAAPGWQALPVKDLVFDDTVTRELLQHIAALRGLTALRIYDVDALPQQVTAAVRQLTGLQQLFLHAFGLPARAAAEQADAAAGAAAISELLRAVAGLPRLSSLVLGLPLGERHFGPAAAGLGAQLSAATGLTALHLGHCSVGDAAVTQLAQSLTALRELVLNSNQLTDVVLPAITSHLVSLTELDLRDTCIDPDSPALQPLQARHASGQLEILRTARPDE